MAGDLNMDALWKARRIVEELTPAEPTIRHITLGANVITRLMDDGLLRYNEPTETYYLPMGGVGSGLYGFADVPVNKTAYFPDLIFIQYSDGTVATNGASNTAHS